MKLDRVTLAVTDMPNMVSFYNTVFDANLQPDQIIGDDQFYRGQLAGIELLMCPNQIAQVDARHNRHQLRFEVEDIAALLAAATSLGGQLLTDISTNGRSKIAAVRDPEGNSIEFIQRL